MIFTIVSFERQKPPRKKEIQNRNGFALIKKRRFSSHGCPFGDVSHRLAQAAHRIFGTILLPTKKVELKKNDEMNI